MHRVDNSVYVVTNESVSDEANDLSFLEVMVAVAPMNRLVRAGVAQ